nr:MAG TPA: Helix-turn-helix XRE-family like protein [Caudoviricetes sp.]
MQNGGGNIYQTARKSAGLTQEAAAERLAVSLSSLRAYEGGERVPAGDVVARMCIVYDTQFLGVQHLQLFGSLLPECVQEARPERLETATIKLVRRIMQFADGHRNDRLLEIAEDGVIDEAERPEFLAITAELNEIIKSALALMYTEEV